MSTRREFLGHSLTLTGLSAASALAQTLPSAPPGQPALGKSLKTVIAAAELVTAAKALAELEWPIPPSPLPFRWAMSQGGGKLPDLLEWPAPQTSQDRDEYDFLYSWGELAHRQWGFEDPRYGEYVYVGKECWALIGRGFLSVLDCSGLGAILLRDVHMSVRLGDLLYARTFDRGPALQLTRELDDNQRPVQIDRFEDVRLVRTSGASVSATSWDPRHGMLQARFLQLSFRSVKTETYPA